MNRLSGGTRYRVRLSVPRSGGWRAWGQVSGRFERRLAEQEGAAVAGAHIESETRRGRDYVRVTISVAVHAPDVAHALATAWWVFRKAAGDDAAGWDMAAATAEVQPDAKLRGPAERPHAHGGDGRAAEPQAASSGPAVTDSKRLISPHAGDDASCPLRRDLGHW